MKIQKAINKRQLFSKYVMNLKKNTEGFCIIQVNDNVFCKPVTHNHK